MHGHPVLVSQDFAGGVVIDKGTIDGVVAAVVRKRAFGTVALGQNEFVNAGIIFKIAKIQAEAVAREITVSVESDSAVYRVDVPNAAVVIKVEVQIHSRPARQTQNGDDVVVALAADDHWHLLGAGGCLNHARKAPRVEDFGARRYRSSVIR